MRSLIGIVGLSGLVGGAVYFLVSGEKASHCGICLTGNCPISKRSLDHERTTTSPVPAVIDLVDVSRMGDSNSPVSTSTNWISFDTTPRVPESCPVMDPLVPDQIPLITDESTY